MPVGGALHSALFAPRHVDASDGGSRDVWIDATPGEEAWLTVFV